MLRTIIFISSFFVFNFGAAQQFSKPFVFQHIQQTLENRTQKNIKRILSEIPDNIQQDIFIE